ncbi:MAG: recombinase family protein [Defluviitaleaceae bacterium]|nr:recombinase family protein [Defluviitaleaceae bacterium]
MNINTYAYVRVSTKDQQDHRQFLAMEQRGIPNERIFPEKLSGKNTKRPALQSLLDTVQKGDTIVVESISRFARNTKDLLGLVEKLTAKGVEFISLKEYIDTTIPTGRFTLTIFAAIAELERECTLLRQAEGIAAAKAQGKHLGRPLKKPPENFAEVVKNWERGKISFDEALKLTGLKRATFYNRRRELRNSKKK